jgi:cysteinyl-tRNA synthetase
VAGSKLAAGEKLALFRDFDRVLGLDLLGMADKLSRTTPEEQMLLRERQEARRQRDWNRSDEVRARLATLGLEVKDTAQGQRWVRKKLLAGGGDDLEHPADHQTQN